MNGNTEGLRESVNNSTFCQHSSEKTNKKNKIKHFKNNLWIDETKFNLYQKNWKIKVWRRKRTAHDTKLSHHLSNMVEACNGMGMRDP